MVNKKKLSSLADKFRAALLLTEPTDFVGTSLSASKFPDACCDDASMLLAAYLVDNGFAEVDIIRGDNGGNEKELPSHVWLQVGDIQVDITADQFNQFGYRNSALICEENNIFLNSFSAQNAGCADFREHVPQYNDPDLFAAFESGYETIKSKLKA